jgi:ketosteroid isomerase-like protein
VRGILIVFLLHPVFSRKRDIVNARMSGARLRARIRPNWRPPMVEDNVQVVSGAYDAFRRGDIPSIIGILHDDVDWHVPAVLPHRFDARGHEEVRQFFGRLAELWDELGVETDDLVASGDHVVVIGRASGKIDGRAAGYGFAHVWVMADGKATRFFEFVDPDEELLSRS